MLLVVIAPMMIIVENESIGLTEVNVKISKEM